MSYKTYSFITKNEANNQAFKEDIAMNFRFHNVREIFTPFRGVICQVYHSYRDIEFGRFQDNYFQNQEEVETYFENHTENHLVEFSKAYPDNFFAFIEVDCFGGKCSSNGYIIRNGERIFENETHHSGHMDLLSRLDPSYKSWFFYPFRRRFFQDKGGINGEIVDLAFPALWMVIDIDYGKNPAFDIQFNDNELLLTKIGQYELYFMKIDGERIKVMGSFVVMSEENVSEINNLIHECFDGKDYYFSLDNFETGEQIVVQTMSDQLRDRLSATSYRANSFNERPFIFGDNDEDLKKDNAASNSDEETKGGIAGFLKRLFGRG